MRKEYVLALLMGLFCCCSSSNLPEFEVIENSVYDAPVKSQISLRLELKGDYTKDQVKELCELMVRTKSSVKMEYHAVPTHIWVYIYKSKADFERDGTSWVAMYAKAGDDDPGEYTYR